MKLVGVINEPPFDPLSWSGTAQYFFRSLDSAGILAGAVNADAGKVTDYAYRALNFSLPVSAWKERYHLDPRRFNALTRSAANRLLGSGLKGDGVLQIGAWYCLPDRVSLPCYSYHDGNLALRVRSGRIALDDGHHRVRQAMRWERETYSKMTGIFVMSAWLGNSFARDFGVPEHKIHVVGAGINFDRIPEPVQRVDVPPRFLMVGKDFERKGGDILLNAFAKVRREVPAAELVLVGPTLPSPPDGVTCLGFLSKKIPDQLALLEQTYRNAGIYVLPSLYEPFGISVLEAMSYSLPCIVANHCAMPEIVQHGTTGMVVAPGDVDSLAAAMTALAKSPETCAEMGSAGRNRLLRHYTWAAVAEKIKDAVSRN